MKLSSLLRGLLLTGVVGVPLYVLSVGPVIILYNRIPSHPFRSSIDRCYRPLNLLYDHTPLGPPLVAYAVWWSNLAPFIAIPEPKVTNAPPPPQP